MVWYSHLLKNIPQFVVIHPYWGSSSLSILTFCLFILFVGWCRRPERSYSMVKIRRGGPEEIPLFQGKEQWLRFMEQL